MNYETGQVWITRDGSKVKLDITDDEIFSIDCKNIHTGHNYSICENGQYFGSGLSHDGDLIKHIPKDKNPEYYL